MSIHRFFSTFCCYFRGKLVNLPKLSTFDMGLYFRKSKKILPGVRINWSKSGPSLSVGPRGAKVSIGKRGTYVSGGIPGTGLYWRNKIGGKKKTRGTHASSNSSYSQAPSASNSQISVNTVLLILFVVIGAAVCLLSGNLVLTALFAIGACVWLFVRSSAQSSSSVQNVPTAPTSSSSAQPPQPVPTKLSQADTDSNNPVLKEAFVAEAEHIIKEMDGITDKAKLPSHYRKLMQVLMKLDTYDDAKIMGLPVKEASRRITENYRKILNS